MTNYDYYRGLNNLKFEEYELSDSYAVVKISYLPKHSVDNEEIPLYSQIVYNNNEDIRKTKVKWLLKEVEFPFKDDFINDDTLYVPKHANVEKQYKYCFEG